MPSDREWVKIRSWHVVRTFTRGSTWRTVCGRQAPGDAPTADVLPSERSCETCLRIIARVDDVPFDVSTMSQDPA